MSDKCVGRFQVSAKGYKGRKDALRRTGGRLTNVRPSSSGAGRKLTAKQKERIGINKESAIDPRWMQYGLPALLGGALGSMGGGGGMGIMGALLGAGAGTYFTPERRAQLQQYVMNLMGGGADNGVGSSAKPPVSSPSSIGQPAQALPAKMWTEQKVDEGVNVLAQSYIRDYNLTPEVAYRSASNKVFEMVMNRGEGVVNRDTSGKAFKRQAANMTPEALAQARRTWVNRTAGGGGPQGTMDVLGEMATWTAPGMAYEGMKGIGELVKGNYAGSALPLLMGAGGARTTLGMVNAARALRASGQGLRGFLGAGAKGMKSAPGSLMLWKSLFDVGDIGLRALNAPVDPNLSTWGKIKAKTRMGGESFGRGVLNSLYDPKSQVSTLGRIWQGGTSMAAAPVAAAVAHGDALRASDALQKNLANMGMFTKDPRTGRHLKSDDTSRMLRRKLRKVQLGTDPMTMLRSPFSAAGTVLGNAFNWWTR